jgi:ubiquinone/menaquinone biosynthesis C-methylase UbiE
LKVLKGKGPVVNLNRSAKAQMINAFLEDALQVRSIKGLNILDVGCGNGQIGRFFSEHNQVYAVDVKDQRDQPHPSVVFTLINDEHLPFADNFFDVVISHHVIEHVNNQSLHIEELKRVLKDSGVIYLGCPNKGSPFMAGHIGNAMVLDLPKMLQLFNKHDLRIEECYTRFLSQPERYCCDLTVGRFLPAWFIRLFRRWYPSQCFLLRLS